MPEEGSAHAASTLRADFLYEVDGLWVADGLLGESVEVTLGGLRISATFPAAIDAFPAPRIPFAPVGDPFPGREYTGDEHPFSGASERTDDAGYRAVHVIRVQVVGPGTVGRPDFEPDIQSGAAEAAFGFLERAQAAADSLVSHLLDWARANGQSWLGLHGQPTRLTGVQSLWDDEAGSRLPVGWPHLVSVIEMGRGDTAITPTNRSELLEFLQSGEEMSIPTTLISDARSLLRGSGHDQMRAVLSAAVAVEIEVKRVLREESPEVLHAFIDVALNSPRDFSFAAAGLFDKPMKAAIGRSLKEDDKPTYVNVNVLFETRNRIAHRGEQPKPDEARAVVKAAEAALAWLSELRGSGRA
jgi:hypothetical protein